MQIYPRLGGCIPYVSLVPHVMSRLFFISAPSHHILFRTKPPLLRTCPCRSVTIVSHLPLSATESQSVDSNVEPPSSCISPHPPPSTTIATDVHCRKRQKKVPFKLCASHDPAGDQPKAINHLTAGLHHARRAYQTLRGVTGSGKTFMMANVIANANLPTLVLAPNKTLAAQLYNEFSRYFPNNRVEFFVSHFKHYRPEAYLPNSDTYIAKSSSVDHEIDRLRHAATKSLFERSDTIVVASVSSIYGLGLPSEYLAASTSIHVGQKSTLDELVEILERLNYVQHSEKVYTHRGFFGIASHYIDVSPPWEKHGTVYRYTLRDGHISKLESIETNSQAVKNLGGQHVLYPAKHFVTPKHRLKAAIRSIKHETKLCVEQFLKDGRQLEASRLEGRVAADIEMMNTVGFCQGAENYSLYLSGRDKVSSPIPPPETLLDYMPRDGKWLLFIDESHVTVPQLSAMHAGNAARKRKLIRHGFRLPSSIENRPLHSDEFWSKAYQTIFVSATPGSFELEKSGRFGVTEAVIRPTAVVDPAVQVASTKGQLEHLTIELAKVTAAGGKSIVTTITKKFAEDLADCLAHKPPVSNVLDRALNVSFLHSGIDSVARMQVLEAMREDSSFEKAPEGNEENVLSNSLDVVVGVNLLREGIDLPAVRLVAILDADSEGFLRGETALIQMIGRAARNVNGKVIMYADTMTSAMHRAISETDRRRRLQVAYNTLYNLTPMSVGETDGTPSSQENESLLDRIRKFKLNNGDFLGENAFSNHAFPVPSQPVLTTIDGMNDVEVVRSKMLEAAHAEEFEAAALLRDHLLKLENSK